MFDLASPWMLLLLPLPLGVWFFFPRAPLQLQAALRVPFFQPVANIVDHEKHHLASYSSITLWFVIWSLVVLALSGPRWVGEPRPLEREGYNIMMALDLSGSMEVNDMLLNGRPVSRLAVVKRAATQFVRDRLGDRIGLILFGTRAYLQTPLTYDRHSVLSRIEDATVGLAGSTTSIGDALGLAVKHLQDVPEQGRMIILLTDGVNNSGMLAPLKAAELARADNIKIYTIGLGSMGQPETINGMLLQMNASADLDEDTLKKVANMTGGRYFRATDTQSLQHIYQTIHQLEKVSQEQATIRPQHDYYAWPLAFALILFLYGMADKGGLLRKVRSASRREVLE